MSDKKYYRIDEVAKTFDVSPRTVERWIKSGELDVVKIGHTRRVMGQTLDEIQKKCDKSPPITDKRS
jgi:excisionase family DNA binding protein